MNKNTKAKRQQFLREVIARQGTGDQHNLLMELKKQGIPTTQATISRDLNEMGFIKVRVESGVYRYEYFEKVSDASLRERLKVLFANFVTEIKSANNLILLKTSPGNANGVASLIDGLQRKEILGTIAGDDTILVVLRDLGSRKSVEKEFRMLLENLPKH
jgi:transcriptional regulator of arginine metabolism